jgi:hypothetical protein
MQNYAPQRRRLRGIRLSAFLLLVGLSVERVFTSTAERARAFPASEAFAQAAKTLRYTHRRFCKKEP